MTKFNFKFFLIFLFFITSCSTYEKNIKTTKQEKKYFSSSGFALIYDDNLFKTKVVNKKINNIELQTIHNSLKARTPIKILNPINSLFVETKIHKRGNYPKIFNIVITKEIASLLDLDLNNPYIEVSEIKKNRTFVAKESNIFDEEKNVAEKAPIDDVQVDDITKEKIDLKKKSTAENNFTLVVADFYYIESANNLKIELSKKTKIKNLKVKKISDNKYRLLAGPFKNFKALKTSYISLNNLGFDNLNIYRN